MLQLSRRLLSTTRSTSGLVTSISKSKFKQQLSKDEKIKEANHHEEITLDITHENSTSVARTLQESLDIKNPPTTFMAPELKERLMERTLITGYGNHQFLVNDIIMHGSILCFPQFMTLWKPQTLEEVNKDSLLLLTLMEPSIDLLILGTGLTTQQCPKELDEYLQSHDIDVHVSSSRDAAATFHYLNNNEHRHVAAAILQFDADQLDR